MDNNYVTVTSASDYTIVVDVPEIQLHRVWKKRGSHYPIDRKALFHAYYDPSVEYLFKKGMLTTDDKQFLVDVGLATDEGETEIITLTDTMVNRLLKLMPISDARETMKKLSQIQIEELADYAVEHYKELSMDRIDLLAKASGKNLMRAIELYKAAREG